MNNKIIHVRQMEKKIFFSKLENVYDYYNCSSKNIFLRILRKLHINRYLFYGNWKRKINDIDTIVFFDTGYEKQFSKYVKKKNKNIRTIFWYWNPIDEKNKVYLEDENINEFWTYNKFDSHKYKINYNSQVYHVEKQSKMSNFEKYDIIFMGKDKGRTKMINEIEQIFKKEKLKYHFNIVSNSEKNFIDYDEYLSELETSKCILDVNYFLPCGLSLRPLEALFFEKKLITNNKDIINYDFYDKNNIFILGIDDISTIKDFINKPYKKINREIISYYDFYNWEKRFY